MKMRNVAICLMLMCAGVGQAQLVNARRPYIRSSGEGTVSVRPDQATIGVGVITQAVTAAAATDANASKAQAILDALRRLLGPNADIRTSSFAVTPQPEISARRRRPGDRGLHGHQSVPRGDRRHGECGPGDRRRNRGRRQLYRWYHVWRA